MNGRCHPEWIVMKPIVDLIIVLDTEENGTKHMSSLEITPGSKDIGKKGWFKDSLFLACQRDKNTSENHVIKVYQWAWQHSIGTRTYFSKFWSTTNRTKCNGGCNCKWYLDVRAFEFNYYDHYGAHSIVGELLGSENIIYSEKPEDNET